MYIPKIVHVGPHSTVSLLVRALCSAFAVRWIQVKFITGLADS